MALKTNSTGEMTTQLLDPFGRRIDYVRLSVTDKCNLRCFYCMPEGFRGFEEPGHWLRFDEIERVIGAFAELGVSRIRLTGGEPLLRRDLSRLAARLAADGALYLCLGHEHKCELQPLLRQGISDDGLKEAITEALLLKPERHEFGEQREQLVRFMNMTGG